VKIAEALSHVQLLGVDTSPFIYYIEDYPTYAEIVGELFKFVETHDIAIVTSIVTVTETLTKPFKSGDQDLADLYQGILQTSAYVDIPPATDQTGELAARLRAQYSLRTPDALQLATALEYQCDAFLTNDHTLRRVQEIPILLLDELEIDPPPQPADQETPSP